MVTNAELNFWIVAAIASLVAFGVLWFFAKRDTKNYVEWVRDWK